MSTPRPGGIGGLPVEPPTILDVQDVTVEFPVRTARGTSHMKALKSVSLQVERGQILGLVGESGSGKSTLARVVIGLQEANEGVVTFEGQVMGRRRTTAQRRGIQMVFQDPWASLNPQLTAQQLLSELLRVHKVVPKDRVAARCAELMDMVQLPTTSLNAKPGAMSGGQRQRVAIARALALEPRLLIADEAVAALDVSVQAGIINLIADLSRDLNLTVLFIAHDLAVVRTLCQRVAVIYLGRIVEQAPTQALFATPLHPYTQALLSAVPRMDGRINPLPPPVTVITDSVGDRYRPLLPQDHPDDAPWHLLRVGASPDHLVATESLSLAEPNPARYSTG
ncbi:MAG: ATP-binding cassette domain-containing protein [Bifidobacteriaceae bacterium]|jgi:ABC-type oligopeptide transport system ATPase subunit|nr:ATP-binding cassette domain-containing protein [Bifidobacteriaceae bacterium]